MDTDQCKLVICSLNVNYVALNIEYRLAARIIAYSNKCIDLSLHTWKFIFPPNIESYMTQKVHSIVVVSVWLPKTFSDAKTNLIKPKPFHVLSWHGCSCYIYQPLVKTLWLPVSVPSPFITLCVSACFRLAPWRRSSCKVTRRSSSCTTSHPGRTRSSRGQYRSVLRSRVSGQ